MQASQFRPLRPEVPRILTVGDSAVSVEFSDTIDLEVNQAVRSLDRLLLEAPFEGLVEAVPTYRSLLVHYHPGQVGLEEVREILRERTEAPPEPAPRGTLRVVPTRYGGEDGPDLSEIGRERGLTEAEVIRLHSTAEYTAFMLGFTPGFAYLGLIPAALEMPRKPTPRVRVPAGSVGIARRQTGVYPVASPGGWQLIGRTGLRLFDPDQTPPALILPGDRVRFVPVDAPPEDDKPAPRAGHGVGSVLVLDGGLLTTVQDQGRLGYRRLGVTRAGPMDPPAQKAGNLVLGNAPQDASLETTVVGPTLQFLRTTAFALTGADLGGVLQRNDLGAWSVPLGARILAREGNILSFTKRRRGCRGYIAFEGGIEVPLVLGSRSTDIAGGFGGLQGRALRAEDALALGRPREGPRLEKPHVKSEGPIRVVLGPQEDLFTKTAIEQFLSEPWGVETTSDRVGCRLRGPSIEAREKEIVSDGMVSGSIQVTPAGQPIVMMADAPTTGGYPKIATVTTVDLPRLAQLMPGEEHVRFVAVTAQEAQRLLKG